MRKIALQILLVISLVFTATACAPSQPASHLDTIKKNGTIKVGNSADYPPFESVDKSGTRVGFDIDLMNAAAKELGVKVEWVDMPFDSLIAAVQQGKIDMAISAFNYSDERAKLVDFTDAYFTSEDSFLASDSFTGQVVKPEDVAKFKVGVQTGTTQDTWLTDNLVKKNLLPESNLFRYDRVDQAALDLKSARIDVLMSDYIPAQAIMKQQGGLKVLYHGVLSSGPVNMVIPKGDTALTKSLNDAIKKLKDNGFIDATAQKDITAQ